MSLNFTKMHGLGNDFVVFDATTQPVSLSTEQIRQIADRHFGVGCDQLLLVETAQQPGVDFRYRIFNADGGEVQQCGNGARCFARFVRDKGLSDKDSIVVETASGVITLTIEADGQVRVDMGVPNFDPAALPFAAMERRERYELLVNDEALEIGAVSMGNPHLVVPVESVETAPVEWLGPLLESHSMFPERVNAGFMQVVDRNHIRLRVYERGSGETLACGTGACAAVAVARSWGLLDDEVTVSLRGGDLSVRWAGEGESLWMIGPAVTVFEGVIAL
jgi:diaminopimelate epimerase